MQGELPFFDSPEDALRAAVQGLGGAKKVGHMIWPDKSVDAAQRHLLDCLNNDRADKLTQSQTIFIYRQAKEAGCYAPFQWFAGECGYDARPVTRAEETDRAAASLEAATKMMAAAMAAMERIKSAERLRAA